LERCGCNALRIGGSTDHVHIVFSLSRNHALCDVVEEVKKISSKWMKTQGDEFVGFQWQAGYSSFSVSRSHLDNVVRYIENQDQRHRSISFQDEYRALLAKHDIAFDEKYFWD